MDLLSRYELLKNDPDNYQFQKLQEPNCLQASWSKFWQKVTNFFSWFRPFHNYIYSIQCNYGSTVSSYFTFHSDLIILNLKIGILVYFCALIPQLTDMVYRQENSFRDQKLPALLDVIQYENSSMTLTKATSCYDTANVPYSDPEIQATTATKIVDFLSANGFMLKFPLLYSYFDGRFDENDADNYEVSSRFLAIYLGGSILAFFHCFIYISYKISTNLNLKSEISSSQSQKHDQDISELGLPLSEQIICKNIFTGYDFSITSQEAIDLKKKEISQILLGILKETEIIKQQKELISCYYFNQKWLNKLLLRRILGFILVTLIIIACYSVIIYAIYFQANYEDILKQHQIQDIENVIIWKYAVEFLPQIVMGIFPVVAQILIEVITNFEVYDSKTSINKNLMRNMILQYFIFIIFVGTNLIIATCNSRTSFFLGDVSKYNHEGCESCVGMNNCWENKIASELFKQMTFKFLIQVCLIFLLYAPRALLAKKKWLVETKQPFLYGLGLEKERSKVEDCNFFLSQLFHIPFVDQFCH